MAVKSKKRRGISWGVILFLLVLTAVILWWRGHSYYPLSLDDRVEHPEYRTLRSSGHLGYGYGVAGTLLIFANLLYLARRKFARWNMGSMKTWLDLHVFTGLMGAVFVSFHASFKARSTMAEATSASLAVVVITGLIGRFLYALVPGSGTDELKQSLEDADALVPGLGEQLRIVLEEHPVPKVKIGSVVAAFGAIPTVRRVAADRREAIALLMHNAQAGTDANTTRALKRLSRRLRKEASKEVRAVAASSILRLWRNLHRFSAILMLLTVIFHIGVAWYYGYRWIWSE